MPTILKLDGTDASSYGVWHSGAPDGWLDSPELSVPSANLVGGYGGVLSRYAEVGPRRLRIPIRVLGTSTSNRRANEATLKAKVNRTITVQIDDGTTARTATGRLLRVPLKPVGQLASTVSDGALELLCEDPFWKATSDTTETINGTPNSIDLGTAPVSDWVLTITATGGSVIDVTITLGPFTLVWTGTIATTKALVIDASAFTVKNDGVTAYSTYSGYFPAIDPADSPSVSAVKGSGAGTLGGSLVFRKRDW